MNAQSLITHFHRRWYVPILVLIAISSNACGPIPTPDLPVCSPDAIVAPELGYPSPDRVFIDDLTPTFTWTYPDATCRPESFTIDVSSNFASLLHIGFLPEISMEVSGTSNNWTPTEPLEPATLYVFSVFSESGDNRLRGGPREFYTNPQCGTDDHPSFSPPTLLWPENGAVLNHFSDPYITLLIWNDSLPCVPEGDYLVELSADPSFSHPERVSTIKKETQIGHVDEFDRPDEFDPILTDCMRYYWRVRMDLEGRPDSEDGPWSPVWSFYTNESGICAGLTVTRITPFPGIDFPEIPSDTSWITGIVWHDLCALPYESTDVAPPGCVWVNDIEGYWANGIYESGEPGLAGVTVNLGSGACPSKGFRTAVTRSDGRYSFGPLDAGTYCVSVNPLSEANIPVLIPGSWTFPVRDAEVAEYTITLGAGELSDNNNFGWDFQFLPSPSSGTPTAKLLQNAYCRSGPAIEYRSLTTLFQGLEVPIDGRNPDSSWWWVRVPNSLNHCWLAKENVQTSGDMSKVPIVEAEPLGCWVKQQQGPDKCVAPCPQGAQPGGVCEP